MKNFGLTILLLLSLATASAACSMSCCAGKTQCCCSSKSGPVPHSQKPDGFFRTHQHDASSASGCTCGENTPQPFTESHTVTIPSSNSSLKDGNQAVSGFKNIRLSINDFTFDANRSPPNGHNGLTIPIPLRIWSIQLVSCTLRGSSLTFQDLAWNYLAIIIINANV